MFRKCRNRLISCLSPLHNQQPIFHVPIKNVENVRLRQENPIKFLQCHQSIFGSVCDCIKTYIFLHYFPAISVYRACVMPQTLLFEYTVGLLNILIRKITKLTWWTSKCYICSGSPLLRRHVLIDLIENFVALCMPYASDIKCLEFGTWCVEQQQHHRYYHLDGYDIFSIHFLIRTWKWKYKSNLLMGCLMISRCPLYMYLYIKLHFHCCHFAVVLS